MKANVSLTDSIVGLTSTGLEAELSPASAGREETSNIPAAITIIAIFSWSLFFAAMFKLLSTIDRDAKCKEDEESGRTISVRPG
jgi:hypothetical protein